MSEEPINGEFAAKITELVETFAALDRACDKIQQMKRPTGETMCDAARVKCDTSARCLPETMRFSRLDG